VNVQYDTFLEAARLSRLLIGARAWGALKETRLGQSRNVHGPWHQHLLCHPQKDAVRPARRRYRAA